VRAGTPRQPHLARVVENGRVDDLTALALAAGRGERAALEVFVARTQADVWRLCAHLGDPDHADDLTQEVYERALRALPRFRGDAPARAWVLSIARRTCADDIRRRTRRRALADRLVRRSHPEHEPDLTGATDLAALLDQLDPDRREAFVLTQVLGLSYAEAAAACDCPIGTIRSRVARGRADLLDAMGTDGARRTTTGA
jgi:RNA polymerase sigma-70 factor, ECF subfamily